MSDGAPNVLLVSNGFGEAAVAAYVGRAIATAAPTALLEHLRLVGPAPDEAWPPAVGPQADMPSGGLVANWNVRNLARDVRAGLLTLCGRQWRYLTAQRARDAIVAIGDVYCLAFSLLGRRPTVFVATAKSDFVMPHSRLECAIARRAAVTFARDEQTAQTLRSRGVRALCAGNVMMDGLEEPQAKLPLRPDAAVFALLPGSRRDAPANLAAMTRRLRRLAEMLAERNRPVQAFVAAAPSVELTELAGALRAQASSIDLAGMQEGVVARATAPNLEILLVRGHLGSVLRAADVVLGQAGTGNEQAAGLGKPVVAALAPGEQSERIGWYRMRQQKLLDGALLLLPPGDDAFAAGVIELLDDAGRRAEMGAAGRARIGKPGASAAVASAVLAAAGRRE